MTDMPWYSQRDYWLELAQRYHTGLVRIKPDGPRGRAIKDYIFVARAHSIFESNLIEGAGENSIGDTQRIIDQHFPTLPAETDAYKTFIDAHGGPEQFFTKETLEELTEKVRRERANPRVIIPSMSLGKSTRKAREVIQHYQALSYAYALSRSYATNRSFRYIRKLARDKRSDPATARVLKTKLDEFLELNEAGRLRKEFLLAKTKILNLHRVIGHGLLPKDCPTSAGIYRSEAVHIPEAIDFPGPSLVSRAMEVFYERADEKLEDCRAFTDYIQAAASISYEFVAIHPFPDFNGRLSRIILNMVLWAGSPEITFPVALRGDKKGRGRYKTALLHANRGKITSMEALIAMRFCEVMQSLDRQFAQAGLTTIAQEAGMIIERSSS